MKKIVLSLMLFSLLASATHAQTKINQSFDAQSYDELELVFEYPQLVQIKTGKGQTVRIEGTVDIAEGDHDENFEINTSDHRGVFTIMSEIRDLDKLGGRGRFFRDGNTSVTVSDKGTTVRKDDDMANYINGVRVHIQLVVTVPEGMKVSLDARYGLVEVLNHPAELSIDARYGGVDVSIEESDLLKLEASTQWGQIYSNLKVPLKMEGDTGVGKWISAKASLKKGARRMSVSSQYGNVYLRKN